MKKIRITSLFLSLILLLSAASLAVAEEHVRFRTASEVTAERMAWHVFREIEKGETVNFVLNSLPMELYENTTDGYVKWNDIVYATESKVTAKSSVKWIRVLPLKDGSFMLEISINTTQKARSGKVVVTGQDGYKATLKFKQYGKDMIKTATRSKKTVTIKLSLAKGSQAHYLSVFAFKESDDGTAMYEKSIFNGAYSKTSYKFKVEEGWTYSVSIGSAIKLSSYYERVNTDFLTFDIDKLTGIQKIR